MAMLVLLLMRQIMPIAAGLAGGIALSSFGLVSRGMSWGARRALNDAGSAASWVAGALTHAAITEGALEPGGGRAGSTRSAEHVPSWRDSV